MKYFDADADHDPDPGFLTEFLSPWDNANCRNFAGSDGLAKLLLDYIV